MTAPSPVTISNPDLPTDPNAIAQAIEDLAATIDAARLRTEAGNTVDLTGLDERVRTLCAAIGSLDQAAARPLLPLLVTLNGTLDTLETLLKRGNRPGEDLARRGADIYRTATDRSA